MPLVTWEALLKPLQLRKTSVKLELSDWKRFVPVNMQI